MRDELQLDLDHRALEAATLGPAYERLALDVGDEIASRARSMARKNTGAGAQSIHAELHRGTDSSAFAGTYDPGTDEPIVYVGWDQAHFYMLFSEEGTEAEAAQPALRPALEQTEI